MPWRMPRNRQRASGMIRIQPRLDFSSRIKCSGRRSAAPYQCGCGSLGRPLVGRNGGVDSVPTLASDLMFRVCGVPDRPVGEWLTTADRGPPCGASAGSSSWFVLPLGFRVQHFMVARAAYNMTC
jgi:hypothetical protein